MIINTKNQLVFDTLPAQHWLGPNKSIPLTEADIGRTLPDGTVYKTLYQFFDEAIEGMIEAQAVALGYKNAISARSYAGDVSPFQAQSKQFVRYCGGVWAYAAQQYQLIITAQRDMPSLEDLGTELPAFEDFAE